LDFVVIWAALPVEVRRLTRPAAARDYWDASPVRRYLARQIFRSILIERSGNLSDAAHSLEATLAGMGEEYSLIIFPEGTRVSGEKLGPFKSGIYHIAKHRPGLELVPVYMENLNRILPKGGFLPAPLIGSISFGKPLVLGPGESKPAFLERARKAIENLARI
jgi:1-acyl-sn-glycerol-3-phosphate acyltransferase